MHLSFFFYIKKYFQLIQLMIIEYLYYSRIFKFCKVIISTKQFVKLVEVYDVHLMRNL